MRLETFARSDGSALVTFLVGNDWPFHTGGRPGSGDVQARVAAGAYDGPGVLTCWLVDDGVRVGLVRVWDTADDTAMLDVRLAATSRGRGLGRAGLLLVVERVFSDYPGVRRIEATTRRDNAAMRRVLTRCGFVQEAVFRDGWPLGPDQPPLDAVGYALLRRDHASGTTTPVVWD